MHLRRALLLFALVLGLTALATAIAPAPQSRDEEPVAPPPRQTPVPPATTVTLDAPTAAPPVQRVKANAHVVVEVTADEGGQVEIPKVGQVQSVGEDATAQFDLLALAPGRYDILFEPALSPPVRIGTIVSR